MISRPWSAIWHSRLRPSALCRTGYNRLCTELVKGLFPLGLGCLSLLIVFSAPSTPTVGRWDLKLGCISISLPTGESTGVICGGVLAMRYMCADRSAAIAHAFGRPNNKNMDGKLDTERIVISGLSWCDTCFQTTRSFSDAGKFLITDYLQFNAPLCR